MGTPGFLTVERDGRPLLRVRLEAAKTIVGSHPATDVMLPDPSVPEAALAIFDLGRTFRLMPCTPDGTGPFDLNDGDTFPLGPYHLRLVRQPPAPPSGTTERMEASAAPTCPTLHLETGLTEIRVEPRAAFTIGSAADNDLVLDDPAVSAYHCRLLGNRDGWLLQDLGSTNGTRLNGLMVREVELPAAAELILGRVTLRLRPSPPDTVTTFRGLHGRSQSMRRVFADVPRLAASPEPVLIVGESGVGKELIARGLHEESRRPGAFIALNCGALSPQLVESELFGHIKGAFTGAAGNRAGAFEAASSGTIFLDEVGELPLDLQPKLLRVLESSVVRPVGATSERRVDARVVAATHRNLEELVARGAFREDLFHRLFVLTVRVPPLRERLDDVVLLAEHFAAQQPEPRSVSIGAREKLMRHRWPGNVRELRNVIIRALFLGEGPDIQAEHIVFSSEIFGAGEPRDQPADDEQMKRHMLEALVASAGNRSEAARRLGVSKSTFFDRMKRLGLDKERSPDRRDGRET